MADHDALIADALSKLRIVDEVHAAVVAGIVGHVRDVTGRDLRPQAPAADQLSPWWDMTPRQFAAFVSALRSAAKTLRIEDFADRADGFTLRDLVELTREIPMGAGMQAMSDFREADRLMTERPS